MTLNYICWWGSSPGALENVKSLFIVMRAILNKSWRQHPTRHQLHVHLPPITKTIQVRRTRHAGHCRRSEDELISDVLQWTPHMAEQKQDDLLEQTYSSCVRIRDVALKTWPEAMNDREKWRERIRDIRASGTTWWWWWWSQWSGVKVPIRVLSMYQIELFNHLQYLTVYKQMINIKINYWY